MDTFAPNELVRLTLFGDVYWGRIVARAHRHETGTGELYFVKIWPRTRPQGHVTVALVEWLERACSQELVNRVEAKTQVPDRLARLAEGGKGRQRRPHRQWT